MIVFPAIDLLDGVCVRLQRGDFASQTIYETDPIKAALRFQGEGGEYLHVVDLNAARTGERLNGEIVRTLSSRTRLKIQTGGGVRGIDTVRELAEYCDRIVVGTAGVLNRNFLIAAADEFPDRIVLALDFQDENILVRGWVQSSGMKLRTYLDDLGTIQLAGIIATDVSRDGMMKGPAIEIYQEMVSRTTVPLIASGGVRNASDVRALAQLGAGGVIIGKALYEGMLTLPEALEAAGCARID